MNNEDEFILDGDDFDFILDSDSPDETVKSESISHTESNIDIQKDNSTVKTTNTDTVATYPVAKNDSYIADKQTEKDTRAVMSIDELYAYLRIGEKKNYEKKGVKSLKAREYIVERSIDIFHIIGKEIYQYPNENEYQTFINQKKYWIQQAVNKWRIKEPDKVEQFEAFLETIDTIFSTQENCIRFTKEFKDNLDKQLRSSLSEKMRDKFLDIREIQLLLETAIDIKYISKSTDDRKKFINRIKENCNEKDCVFALADDTFIHEVQDFDKLYRLDTEETRSNLFDRYKELKAIENSVLSLPESNNDESLRESSDKLLTENNLLFDNEKVYREDFYDKKKEADENHFALALYSSDYEKLKGTAIYKYQFSLSQWDDFAFSEGLRSYNTKIPVLIVGSDKAETKREIARISMKNRQMALQRILEGDYETYFMHIDDESTAKKIAEIKQSFSGIDILTNIAEYFGYDTDNLEDDEQKVDTEEKSPMMKCNTLEELIKYCLDNRNDSSLAEQICNFDSTGELYQIVKSFNNSYYQFILTYLHDFALSKDAYLYHSVFENVVSHIMDKIASDGEKCIFNNVLRHIIDIAIMRGMQLSDMFISRFNQLCDELSA